MISLFISEQNLAMFRLLRSCSSARALCVLGGSISAARCEDSSVPRCQRPANGNAVLWRQNPKCEPCGAVLSEEQISHNVKLHHSRNRKPPRDSPEWQGNNEVFRSIKTFTAELKDLLISVCTTEDAGKYWPQMYFFRLKL